MNSQEKVKKVKISKYDVVKVKVYIDQHFFVFSRYIIANLLRVIKIPNRDAQKISSDLKKFLVENNLLEIQYQDFQKYIFEMMKKFNYEFPYIEKFKMINQFYTKRIPLIILITGTVFIGKSTIATKLSERMNISNVLQTKVISDVMTQLEVSDSKPFWMDQDIASDEDLIKRYENESKKIRKGANYDIQKAFLEGKALIIEGHHIIPNLYISKNDEGLNIITAENEEETEREKEVRLEMNKIIQKGIVIPFILTCSEKDQLYLLRNGLFYEGENITFNENEEKTRIRIQNLLNKFQTIQKYLMGLKEAEYFVHKQTDLDNSSSLLDFMQDYILQKIEDLYQKEK
jgi:2-phosphoglycerate kinase